MSEINKSYRIKTDIENAHVDDFIAIDANLLQDYDTFDILSVKIESSDTYKLHNANYGVVVGRVLANNGFGIPNAKISIFIEADSDEIDERVRDLYPFMSATSKNKDGVRYNLLPDEKTSDCHQVVGTFPNKRYALDNDIILEVFDKYYKYTTITNNGGDYLIMGVPVGAHTLHMDLDLSDCGILSQRPRDFVYKGYTIEQFENPNMFKEGTSYSNLSQIFTQDQVINVQPFWGNATLGEKIGLTRADINVSFKFEPTCVFMGSVISDNSSQGITKKCMATEHMGYMEEMNTGEGTIEMIRKTPGGNIEEFQVKGTQLIDGNGVWCYQIPMNLDYMMTDEYGNMVPTDNPEKGIPTRAQVRFRISMQDNEENVDNFFRAKVLVPHNPQLLSNGKHEEYDYEFGSFTRDDSFRDLFWNNVYSVKSYIPRFQKKKTQGWKDKKFTGFKSCNFYGSNNPMPYNNMRIKLPFMFTIMCALIKVFIFLVGIINSLISALGNMLHDLGDTYIGIPGLYIFGTEICWWPFRKLYGIATQLSMTVLKDGLCPDLDNWFFSPMFRSNLWISPKQAPPGYPHYDLLSQTLIKLKESSVDDDKTSIDVQNDEESDEETICLTIYTDYLISCIEMNLAMEYKVINFDFYNDWINGTLYFPRFMRYLRPKKTFLGITFARAKIKGCMDDTQIFSKTRRYTQQCSMGYKSTLSNMKNVYTNVNNVLSKGSNLKKIKEANNLHKKRGFTQKTIFGENGGICHEHTTSKGQYVYYMKPCEWTRDTSPNGKKVNLFATDIILLGSLNDCDIHGIPQSFKYLSSTSYILPTNLALTNMESNGPLYTTTKGTICAGKSTLSTDDIKTATSGVTVASVDGGISGELAAYSGAQNTEYDIQYDKNELSDIIALTEAAGISWNYTGPGQGTPDDTKMYQPGGHFLGLSCVNSQTNIKSCINLIRVCEVGSNISQRKEDITNIDRNGNISYTYSAPSGFISGDDIVGANFRTMFATMNHKRLIATKTNPITGYKMYDFDFMKPINFDGTFKSVINMASSPYNQKINLPSENVEILRSVGIETDTSVRKDHDSNESISTQIRTIEDTSLDYYLFRFGLNYDELTTNNQKHLRKFLYSDNGVMYLPQYENSYYFYFGLKNGATAIDEFNKQFFSECENGMLIAGEPVLNIGLKEGINVCRGSADVVVSTNNLETPYKFLTYTKDGKNTTTITTTSLLSNYTIELPNISFGTYVFTIRDANDIEISKTEKIGTDILTADIEAYDFNAPITYNRPYDGTYIEQGGYIKISNVKIDGLEDGHPLTLRGTNGTFDINDNSEEIIISNNSSREYIFYAMGTGIKDISVSYKCEGYDKQTLLLQSIDIHSTNDITLNIGYKDGPYSALTQDNYSVKSKWWETNIEDNSKWLIRNTLFNEVPINKRGKETTSLNIFANEGSSKCVWGLSQNYDGVNTDIVCCSEDGNNIPVGYSLDDDYLYYPTYMYNNNEITHFSAIAYKGNMVMGNYEKYLNPNDLGKKIYSNKLISGYGYVFKPLVPIGDLQFHVYDEEKGYIYTPNPEGEEPITRGLFYPSVAYPSFDRPFQAKTRFYTWNKRLIDIVANENNVKEPRIYNKEYAGKTEIDIYNGVTYTGKFHNSSYINNLEYITTIPVTKYDTDGISNGENRITSLSGFRGKTIDNAVSGITNFSYEIIGGCSNNTNLETVNRISDNIISKFSAQATYALRSDGSIDGPYMDGEYNSETEYFLCFQPENESNKLIDEINGGIIYNTLEETSNVWQSIFYVECKYTSGAEYNTEGETLIATFVFNGGKQFYCVYDIKNEEGTIYKNTVPLECNYNKTIFENIKDGALATTHIECIPNYGINTAVTSQERWEAIITRHADYFLTGNTNNGILYTVGRIENEETDTVLYKIYPNTMRVNEIKNVEAVNITIDKTLIEAAYDGGIYKVLVKGSDTRKWKTNISLSNSFWIDVTPNKGSGRTGTEVSIEVSKNNTGSDREGEIIFYTSSTADGVTVVVKQTSAREVSFEQEISTATINNVMEIADGRKETISTLASLISEANKPRQLTYNSPQISVSTFEIDSENLSLSDITVKAELGIYENNEKIVSKEINIVGDGVYTFEDIIYTPSIKYYDIKLKVTSYCDHIEESGTFKCSINPINPFTKTLLL